MKKIFAAFCAIVLMPSFSAQAWIGGPFSNNSFFEPAGTDGVYEASATTLNGIGLFRFSVGNEFQGVNNNQVTTTVPGDNVVDTSSLNPVVITTPGIASGNAIIGAWGNVFTNFWYYRGVQYVGRTNGTVNATLGKVIAFATSRDNLGQGTNVITTAFSANLVNTGEFIAATTFIGVGRAFTSQGQRFRFTVMGSKVSNNIFLGL
jgi:hypothetical protein